MTVDQAAATSEAAARARDEHAKDKAFVLAVILYLPYISPISPLCLPYISPVGQGLRARGNPPEPEPEPEPEI